MMPKNIKCSPLDCALFGLIVVFVLILIFRKEKFDTSIGVRSQVGDSTNLDTTLGTSGSFPGDVYNCSQPILMIQPDNAYTWGDSKDYIDDKSLAFAKSIGKGIENLREPLKELTPKGADNLSPEQVLMVLRENQDKFPGTLAIINQPTLSPVRIDGFKSDIKRLVFARQNSLNQNDKIMVPLSWSGEHFGALTDAQIKSWYINCKKHPMECFTDINSFDQNVFNNSNKSRFEPFDTNSESTWAAVMNGYNPQNNQIVQQDPNKSGLRDRKE